MTEAMPAPSPHKLADPLGWPFGALPVKDLDRLYAERDAKQPKPVYEPAPF